MSLVLASCGGPTKQEYDTLVHKYDSIAVRCISLSDSVRIMKTELEGYRNAPEKLCANLNELYKNEDLDALQLISIQLRKYHPESQEFKTVLSMCEKIEDNRQKKLEKEKQLRMKAVNKLKMKYDDVSGTTWYHNPYFTHYVSDNRTSLYIGKNGQSLWLRLKMSYGGSDWIFFDRAFLSYDGNTKEIVFDKYKEQNSDNDGGDVWEWIDVAVDESTLVFLRNLANSKTAKMRLTGKYSETRTLSSSEMNGIRDILLAYDVLMNGE